MADMDADIGLGGTGGDAGGQFSDSGDGGIERGFGSGQLGSDVVGGKAGLGHRRDKGLNGHREKSFSSRPWGRVVGVLSDDHRPKG
jgi:hypothetical protein